MTPHPSVHHLLQRLSVGIHSIVTSVIRLFVFRTSHRKAYKNPQKWYNTATSQLHSKINELVSSMASRTAQIIGRRILPRIGRQRLQPSLGQFSTNVKGLNDPSTFVQGVTVSDLEKDPVLAEYFAVNFPEYGTEDETGTSNDSQPLASEISSADAESEGVEEELESPLNIRTMSSYKRAEEGSISCYRLRERDFLIPGLIYGSDPTQKIVSNDPSSKILVKTPLNEIQREMDRYTYHNFESRVYDLTVFEDEDDEEGVVHRIIPANVQHHPWQKKIYCCNFLRYFPGKPIKIPIVYINEEESGALKRDGFIVPQNRHVTCNVEDGVPIPEAVEMDCTGLKLKEVIRMDRLIFPDGVKPSKLVDEKKFLVGSVFGRGGGGATTGDEEEAE